MAADDGVCRAVCRGGRDTAETMLGQDDEEEEEEEEEKEEG